MNAAERAPYLDAGDAALSPLGFRRKKKEYKWQRVALQDVEWVHLNFGLTVINPSYGVRYADIEASVPTHLGFSCGPFRMLQDLTGTHYSSEASSPSLVSRDLLRAVDDLPKLRDREAFAEILKRDDPPRDITVLRSARMRMLPMLLVSFGRVEEAFAWLARFEREAPSSDQMVPAYDVFAAYFRSAYQPKSA